MSVFSLDDFRVPLPPAGGVFGIGLDLAEVDRVEEAARGQGFRRQVFAPEELDAFADRRWDPQGLAQAFALKEAFLKALGTGGLRIGLYFHDICGPPAAAPGSLRVTGRAAEVAEALGVRGIHAGSSLRGAVALGWVVLTV